MRTVAAGRLRFQAVQSHSEIDISSDPVLRRCIHRLEKGLTMRPRSPVFALDYIADTVDAFEAAVLRESHSRAELQWAADVLAAYFLVVVEDGGVIAKARLKFDALARTVRSTRGIEPNSSGMSPKPHSDSITSTIDFESLLTLIRRRKSVRWFKNEPVARELLDKAIVAASFAPSACNRQPFLFHIVNGLENTSRVASIAMGTAGYSHQIPVLIVVVGDFSAFESERDRHLPYIDGSLAAMQLMLACETLGLGTCPINWPDIEARERRMAAELQLAEHLRPIMLIAVGYPDPDGQVAFSTKKTAQELLG